MKLINKGGLFLAELFLPFKNRDAFEPIRVVLDTGALITIVDPGFTDYLGYSIIDAFTLSKLDGVAGESKGYSIKVLRAK